MAKVEGEAYVVHAEWDDEAAVWVATSDDVPGLVTEGATLELLVEKLRMMVPEMLELNHVLPAEQAAVAPFRVLAERLERPRAVV
jgi:predicted RNase H-like HicB family nuclease